MDKENYNIDLHNYQLNENKKELKQSFNSNLVQMAGIVEPRRGNSTQDYCLIRHGLFNRRILRIMEYLIFIIT